MHTLSSRDARVIWHPYTQMQTAKPAVGIVKGAGAYLYDEDGNKYIDAIASWWTNIHGHAHPYLAAQIAGQANTLEHVIFAGFTHEPAVKLAEEILARLPGNQQKVFYSDNGSTAVEVALKMTMQFWFNKGQARTKIIAFEGYHGDTFGAMAVSARTAFTRPFDALLFDVLFLPPPEFGKEKESVEALQAILNQYTNEVAAFIYEPLVQGTAGMRMMNPAALNELMALCKSNQVMCIADEVMTGFGRTGKMFASEFMELEPDLFCLSKGLTGGMMALGMTTCTTAIYEAFLSNDRMKTFFHGHSYTANPIACAAGVASLHLFETENTLARIAGIAAQHKAFLESVLHHPAIQTGRTLGVILALELKTGGDQSYFNPLKEQAAAYFFSRGILLRPLGHILYLMPPYCIAEEDLRYIYSTIVQFLDQVK
jgi:adenosylmethionine-8-amino-7-oxononanoate aminotransferase